MCVSLNLVFQLEKKKIHQFPLISPEWERPSAGCCPAGET